MRTQTPDRATVAKCLECYRMKRHEELVTCRKKSCPYNNNDPEHGYWCCSNSLLYDAVALLKEQEPQSVIVKCEPSNGNILWFANCPKCGQGIERDKHKNHCGYCGQAVKWE